MPAGKDLNYVLDRFALEDLLGSYCRGVDSLSDMDGLLACFTQDAVFDLGGIGLPRFDGHAGIRGFFTQVFADMTHHAHFPSNFRIERLEGDAASITAYIMGMGRSKDGTEILVYVFYELECVRTAEGWKISAFGERPMMPMPSALTDVHAR